MPRRARSLVAEPPLPEQIDPTEMPPGSERVLVFRALDSGRGRALGGLVDVLYRSSPATQSMRALEDYLYDTQGPGRYRVVIERMIDAWHYLTSTTMIIDPIYSVPDGTVAEP